MTKKLYFRYQSCICKNGGNGYNSSSQYRDKVWANQKPFTLNLHGILLLRQISFVDRFFLLQMMA